MVQQSPFVQRIHLAGVTSPFAAAFAVPLTADRLLSSQGTEAPREGLFPASWRMFAAYLAWSSSLDLTLLAGMIWLFRTRWRVSQ